MPSRLLEIPGTFNLRDIGGYRTADSHVTRWQQVFRSDSLHALPPGGQTMLLQTGLRTVIDLRRPDEVAAEPDVIARHPQIDYHELPILQAPVSSETDHALRGAESLEDVYRGILDRFQMPLSQIFQTIADAAEAPLLVHCSVGKDRTGLVIALLLDLVDVPPVTIVEDYTMTKELIEPLRPVSYQKAMDAGLNMPRHDRMMECRAETMVTMLDHLHTRYGGSANYLRRIGLSDAQIAAIRARLVGTEQEGSR